MILKIQKPYSIIEKTETYLIYNKNRSLMLQDIEVGQVEKLDSMFNKNEYIIYVEGYIDKKDRLIIKRKLEEQEW